jgi:hypothetical protein
MVESVDTPDLKSVGHCLWEFKSPCSYWYFITMTQERTSTLERLDPFHLPIFLYYDAITDEQCDILREFCDSIDTWGTCIDGNDNAMHLSGDKNILSRMPEMKFHFEALMQDISTQVMKQVSEKFEIRTSWVTKTEKGQVSSMHNHKNFYMAGVLYLQDDNYLMVKNPYFDLSHFMFSITEQSAYTCNTTLLHAPKNSFILMPSYLFHQVPSWEKDDIVRYSIAMNFHPVGTYGVDTSLLTV